MSVVGTYTVGLGPTGLCFDGQYVWVANSSAPSISKILASTGSVIGTYALTGGFQPWNLCFDGVDIWVTCSDVGMSTIKKITQSTGAVAGTYTIGGRPTGLCFDGTNLWVTCQSTNQVMRVSLGGSVLNTYIP